MRIYRAALIGCGRIGSELADDPRAPGIQSHAEAYVACEATELVAVCDTDPARLERCGERWGVAHRYSVVSRLLAESAPEIVSICTPDETHADIARSVLEAPRTRALFVEKPLALEVEEARELVLRARARRIVLAVNYARRFAPGIIALREWLDANSLGDVRAVSGYYTKGLVHNGSHWIDLARALVGDVESVSARHRLPWPESDPTLDLELRFARGARGYLIGCDERDFTVFEMDLVGTRGRVRITDTGYALSFWQVGPSPRYSGYQELVAMPAPVRAGLEDVLLHAVRDIVQCVESGREPRCSGEDALAALAVCRAAHESLVDGGRHRDVRL